MESLLIPLIARGRVIEDDLVSFPARRGRLEFRTPDVRRHMADLVLADPTGLSDLYRLSLDDIVDYLVELGTRLHPDRNAHVAGALQAALGTTHISAAMQRRMFRALPSMMTREALEEMVEDAVGRAYLEGWVEEPMIGRTVSVRAFGARTAHIIAGNAPGIAVRTVALNALCRSDAIIKIPSNDPYFSTALALTMIEMAPEHPVTRHLTVAYWKGGDREVESRLYDPKNLEKIVAWGGFDSMRSIREYIGPGLDLIALDPKLSASIVGRAALKSDANLAEAARRTAYDIGIMNQGGCLNARVVYLECGTDDAGVEAATKFGQLVFDAIQALPEDLSSPHPAFDADLKAELDGIRYSDDFRVIGGKTNEGAVVVSQYDEPVDFADRLDCRVANIVPVDSISYALRRLTIHTQTIGIYPDELKATIRDECALRGGQRIVSLGFATSGNWAGPHDAIEPMRRMLRWIRDDDQDTLTGSIHVSE
jgi:Acyl-CoA reductase (LuxC)